MYSTNNASIAKSASAAPPPQRRARSKRGQSRSELTSVAASDPISEVADLQSIDGSFALDNQLLALLRRKKGLLSLDVLKAGMPESIRGAKDADTIWATVLATAYMMVALADSRSVWDSLWDKAQELVCREMSISPFQFNQLVQAASAELQ